MTTMFCPSLPSPKGCDNLFFYFYPSLRDCVAIVAIFLFQQHRLLRWDFVPPHNDDIDVLLSFLSPIKTLDGKLQQESTLKLLQPGFPLELPLNVLLIER
jgi:hypothetical protein